MEFGEERAFRERIGGVSYESPEWKRVPTLRFRHLATEMMNRLEQDISAEQRIWVESKMYLIPNYQRYNPIATVMAFTCMDFDKKNVNPTSFHRGEKLLKRHSSIMKAYGINVTDLVRYARRWELWCRDVFDE